MDRNLRSKTRFKEHWEEFGLYYVLLVVACVLFIYPLQDKTVVQPVVTVAKPVPGLSLVAKLKSNELHEPEKAILTIEASSDPGVLVENMQVCISSPEFAISTANEPNTYCPQVFVFNKSDIRSRPTPTEIELIPNKSSGSAKLLVTASWVRYVPPVGTLVPGQDQPGAMSKSCADAPQSCSQVREQAVMTLGPVNLGINKLAAFGSRFWSFVKELTLPIILIILANRFTRKASAQEEEKQIALILLPKVMRLTGRFYLPMAHSASKFVQRSKEKGRNAEELTFYLLSFLNISRALKEQEGGVFFKDLTAEQIFGIANNVIRALVLEALTGEKQLMELLDLLDSWVPTGRKKRWARFSDKPSAVPPKWITVQDWLVGSPKGLNEAEYQAICYLFKVVAATLRYEGNAPFASWYTSPTDDDITDLEPKPGDSVPEDTVFGEAYAGDLAEFKKKLRLFKPTWRKK